MCRLSQCECDEAREVSCSSFVKRTVLNPNYLIKDIFKIVNIRYFLRFNILRKMKQINATFCIIIVTDIVKLALGFPLFICSRFFGVGRYLLKGIFLTISFNFLFMLHYIYHTVCVSLLDFT